MVTLTIRIQTRGIAELNRRWKLFRNISKVNVSSADKIGDAITRVARIFAPFFKGELGSRIDYEVVTTPKGVSLKIVSDAPYAHFQEEGFTPHFVRITPYVKEWLDAHSTGAPGFQPGQKGYIFVSKFTPHIRPAIEVVRPNVDRIMKEGVDNFLERNFGGVYR